MRREEVKFGRGGRLPPPAPRYEPIIDRIAPWIWLGALMLLFWWLW